MKKITSVLVANRGEIAIRVFRACHEMGIRTIAVYSKEDSLSLHRFRADESYLIGKGKKPVDAYLDIEEIIRVAHEHHVDAIHPGYGFLSENADLARRCAEEGITFIGPHIDHLTMFGDKVNARAQAKKAGIRFIPGSDGPVMNFAEVEKFAKDVGFPIMLKAVNGGGGRGMRMAHCMSDLKDAYERAKSEAKLAFGNDEIYLEKYIRNPKHVEVQIMGDEHGNVFHLYERDCSIQRRNQKLIEEAPARCLTPELREEMGRAAVKAAQAVHYEGAGTVEFLLDSDGQHFYFMEMNTRIQVEHGVTEMITGVDLVRQQLRIASGLPLDLTQEDVTLTGHAIECRINAEDPTANFRPCPGKVEFLHFPGGPGVRVDSALYNGCTLSPYYDSLAAKVMVHAPTRLEAIRRMRRCLEEFTLEGFPTNAELSYELLFHPTFVRGGCTTAFLDRSLPELLEFSRRVDDHKG